MTVETEFIPRFQERESIIGSMRVVAFYTIALDNNFMTAFRVLRYNAFMALQADFIRIFVQQLPVGGSMRVMTF